MFEALSIKFWYWYSNMVIASAFAAMGVTVPTLQYCFSIINYLFLQIYVRYQVLDVGTTCYTANNQVIYLVFNKKSMNTSKPNLLFVVF
jgi:hypothetical protein